MNKLGQGGQGGANVFEARLRLPPAEVGQRPRRVAQHRQLGSVGELLQERAHRTLLKHEVPAHGGVARDVAQRPDL